MNMPRKLLFWAVALGHMVNDIFMSMGPTVLTFLSGSTLPITTAQIGLADGMRQLVSAFTQPAFGLMADRSGGRRLGAGGVAWTVSVMCVGLVLGALTQNFWIMFIPYVLSAAGSGAFHPVGALHAAESDETRVASSVSWFFLMGQLGLALGPFMAGLILERVTPGNLSGVLLLAPLAIPPVILMALRIPNAAAHRASHPPRAANAQRNFWRELPVRSGLILLALVILRSLAQPGAVPFIPALFEEKGWTPSQYGSITSVFWLASGLAGVWFGSLADRFDRRWVLMIGLVASAPGFFLLPTADGPLAFALAVLAGGLSSGSHSIIVVLAQELLPSGKGFASGMILGTIFGVGALGSMTIGFLSNSIGLTAAFHLLSAAVAVAGLIGLLLPKHTPQPALAPAAGD